MGRRDQRGVGCHRVFAFLSAGADTKANAQELVREAGGLLERLQRGVALEALSESDSSLGVEAVGRDTVSTGAEAGAGHVNGR